MISFTVIKSKAEFLATIPGEMRGEVSDYIDASLDFGYSEVAVTIFEGLLLLRVYDEGYSFISPIPLTDEADERDGVKAIREYAVKEDIPLFFADVPTELAEWMQDYFADIDISYDEDDDVCEVAVNTPVDMMVRIPKFDTEHLTLTEIDEGSVDAYYRLSTEKSGLLYYGYSYADDTENPSRGYFYHRQKEDYYAGLALTLGVYYGGELIGECVLHRFDLIGGAEISIRLLPEFRSRGFGREILVSIIRHRKTLDIKKLYATIREENLPSIKLFSSIMDESYREAGLIHYEL